MKDDDNTILWILLGAAAAYFFMKRQGPAPAPGYPSLPAARGTPSVTQNADGSLTVNDTLPPLPNVKPYSPDLNLQVPGENSSSLVLDPNFGINPDSTGSW
jgi:hypothetical protein